MAQKKHTRTAKKRNDKKHKYPRSSKRTSKNVIKKTLDDSMMVIKKMGNKYIPMVKSGLSTIGKTVITTAKTAVPKIDNYTRKLLNKKTTPKRKHHKK